MDEETLHKVQQICEKNISKKIISNYRTDGEISDSTKNRISEYINTIITIEEIRDNLLEDENYYD